MQKIVKFSNRIIFLRWLYEQGDPRNLTPELQEGLIREAAKKLFFFSGLTNPPRA